MSRTLDRSDYSKVMRQGKDRLAETAFSKHQQARKNGKEELADKIETQFSEFADNKISESELRETLDKV